MNSRHSQLIARLSEVRDQAASDVKMFEEFEVSIIISWTEARERVLEHLRGTIVSCDDLIERARNAQDGVI